MNVPSATSLKDIYPEDALEAQTKRWTDLLSKFEALYGKPAEFVARSPGRVNIIGEHIDYSMYEVLPMAMTVDMLLAIATVPGEPTVEIANVDDAKFPKREFRTSEDGEVDIDPSSLEWSNYFKAGMRGAVEMLKAAGKPMPPTGLRILVHGTVPTGSGLSSSSAFVCASVLGVLIANGVSDVNKMELTECAIKSERAVGVYGGGMDQTASVQSLRGSATYVKFKPALEATPIKFPDTDPELAFVVAQSFVTSDKHVTAPVCYNLRVVECTLAANILAKIFGLKRPLPTDKSSLGTSLRGFQDTYFEEREGISDNNTTTISDFLKQLETLHTMVEDYLPQEEGYTRDQMASLLDISVDELSTRFLSKFPVRADRFMLRQRALHVFSEAARVIRFRELLAAPPPEGGAALLAELGALMNETQDSCRDVYECSCPELDELCTLARGAGAKGSRLTGAGWGGASVHLVAKDKVDKVIEAWTERYYKKRWPDISEERLAEAIVVSKPGSGSYVFKVTSKDVV